jgi:hypothetical protein
LTLDGISLCNTVLQVSRLDDPSAGLVETLVRLGKRHHELGVSPKQYCSMQLAILSALEELLGDEWTTEYQEAWASAFTFITHVMIKAAAAGNGSASTSSTPPKSLGGAGACPMPFVNKYLAHAVKEGEMAGNTDGHRLQRLHHGTNAAKIEEEA